MSPLGQEHDDARNTPGQTARIRQGWIIFVIVAIFIVASIAEMVAFDHYGEARAGKMGQIKDAPEQ